MNWIVLQLLFGCLFLLRHVKLTLNGITQYNLSVSDIDKIPVTGFNQENVKVVYYRTLYPFEARSHDEITIHPGDIVMVSNF